MCACVALIGGCGKLFDLTPYDTEPPGDLRDRTAANVARIEAGHQEAGKRVTFALTSDPHYHYGDLGSIVARMRGDASVGFVVVTGDLTDQGLLGEFEWFARNMDGLEVPWLAAIGNHDHLGNGRTIYETMFGPRNFTMETRDHRFIFFDDTVWESGMPPDMDWLERALANTGDRTPIVIAHIPPFTDQLSGPLEERMRRLVADAGVPLFLHGHQHVFRDHEPYADGVRYVCVPWPMERAYVRVTLDAGEITIERVEL